MASGSFTLTNTGNTSRYIEFTVNWSSASRGSSYNSSYVYVDVICKKKTGSTSATYGNYNCSITLDGQTQSVGTTSFSVSPNSSITLASKTFEVGHNDNGTKSINISASVGGNVMWGSGESGWVNLDTIPRYPSVSQSVGNKSEVGITMNYSANATCNHLWYSINNGSSWIDGGGINGSSGSYTITGLTPNTTYNIKTKLRRSDSGLEGSSGGTAVSTYDYPKATNVPNFIIGESITITFYNPLNREFRYKVLGNDNSELVYKRISGTSDTITIPASDLYNSIPTSQTGTLKVECYYSLTPTTYTGGTYQIVVADCLPSFDSVSYQDTYSQIVAITGNNQKIVSGHSKVEFRTSAITIKNGADVNLTTGDIRIMNPDNLPIGTLTLGYSSGDLVGYIQNVVLDYYDTTSKDIYLTIKDARGLSITKKVVIDLIDYQKPTATFSVKRQSNFYSNTDFLVNANYTQFGSNALSIKTRYKQEGSSTWSSWTHLTNNTTSTISLDNEYYWNIEILVSDSIQESNTYSTRIQRGIPVFYVDTTKNSIGVNCFPEYENDIEVEGSPINTKHTTDEVACGDYHGNTMYRVSYKGLVEDYININNNLFGCQIWDITLVEIVGWDINIYDKTTGKDYKLPYVDLQGASHCITPVNVDYVSGARNYIDVGFTIGRDLYYYPDDHDVRFNIDVYYTKSQG